MEQQSNKFTTWIKTSSTAKMLMIGFLSFILIIPLIYIEDLIRERSHRQKSVVREIGKQWGNEVSIYGPIIKIPYKTYTKKTVTDQKTKKITYELIEDIKEAYFFPDELDIEVNVNPQEKKRGIYKTAVYESKIAIKGNFDSLNFNNQEIKEKDILWHKSKVLLRTTNVKGVNDLLSVKINDKSFNLSSSGKTNRIDNSFYTLESKSFNFKKLKKDNKSSFSLDYSVKGCREINFVPIGKKTTAQMISNWKTANFIGEFLPYNPDKISLEGFNAKWKVLDINRPFSQNYYGFLPNLKEFSFGVNFKIPVDEYQKSERSAKYGFLVISLTFLIFFLIQTISKINMHPFQYLMIGLALLMFYTLLVSISEHSSFLKAYGIASISVVSLITLYSKSILNSNKFALFVLASLTVLYGFILVIIQLESYALLVGSIGLFTILASVMYTSRKIKW